MRKFVGLALLLAVTLTVGCATKSPIPASNRKSLVLIHGVHFNSEVWNLVKPELKGDYDIFAVDLLGRTLEEHATLTEMAQDLCARLASPAMIVAHSFGGVVVNQMAGICPNKIERVVYVSALVPLDGEKAFDKMSQKDQRAYQTAVSFDQARITPKAVPVFLKAVDALIDVKNPPAVKLFSESYGPGQDTVRFDKAVLAKIPKYYIFTSLDKLVSLETQKKYVERMPMVKTESVASGHLPMLSRPKELAVAISKCLP